MEQTGPQQRYGPAFAQLLTAGRLTRVWSTWTLAVTAVVMGGHNIGGEAKEPERHDRNNDEEFHRLLR